MFKRESTGITLHDTDMPCLTILSYRDCITPYFIHLYGDKTLNSNMSRKQLVTEANNV